MYTKQVQEVKVEPSPVQKNETEELSEDSNKKLEEKLNPNPLYIPEEKDLDIEKETDIEEDLHTYETQEKEDIAQYSNEELPVSVEDLPSSQIANAIEQINGKIEAILERVEKPSANEPVFPKELDELIKMQREIKNEFDAKLRYDQHKEQLIDKLHKELQEYKEDVVKKAMQPFITDLIMVNDNIFKLVENYRSVEGQLNPKAILNQLSSITTDIDDVLYRQGVEPFETQEEQVDPLRQKILKTIKVSDTEKEKLIAERLRRGYQWDEKIIRKELVSVYVFDKHAATQEGNQTEGVDTK